LGKNGRVELEERERVVMLGSRPVHVTNRAIYCEGSLKSVFEDKVT
jgi:hypothetical protein